MSRAILAMITLTVLTITIKAETSLKSVTAFSTSEIVIDGKIESTWLKATPAVEFIQREPDEGVPASFNTRVYVLFDRDAIYFAFDCYDPSPDSIRALIKRRESTGDADKVGVFIDSFHDNRNGYYFYVSAGGIQADGTISDETEMDGSWNAVWKSAVIIHSNGWSAELRIPFNTFRHGGSRPDGWGINFLRLIHRLNEELYWSPATRQHGNRVNEYGTLHGLTSIDKFAHAEILPHLVGTWSAAENSSYVSNLDRESVGIDVKVVPDASWTMDLTYQPDFAQVDVDRQVINLDPYPIYLSERRPFFLEGLDLFTSSDFELLYTRRITDPHYGGRITGRRGKLRGTALVARNRDRNGQPEIAAAGRAEIDAGSRNKLGLTATWLERDDYRAVATSADATIRWSKWHSLNLSAAAVDKPGNLAHPLAARLDLFLSEGLWRGGCNLEYTGEDFDLNDLGWSGYSNVLLGGLWGGYRFYPKTGFLRSAILSLNYDYFSLVSWQAPYWSTSLLTMFEFRNYWSIMIWPGWGNQQWRTYPDDTVGEYRDNFGRFNSEKHPVRTFYTVLNSDDRTNFTSETFWYYSGFYDGKSSDFSQEFVIKPKTNLWMSVEMSWSRYWDVSWLADGEAQDYRLWYFKARYSPTLNTSLRATLQWVQHSDWLGFNAVYTWNWKPGSWLYLVYDEQRYIEDLARSQPGDRKIHLKWTYFITVP